MLRISTIESGNHYAILRLEGRLAGPWVAQLSDTCERLLREGCALELDFAGVSFVDPDGVALVSDLKSRGIALTRCPPFVEQQLADGLKRC